MRFTIRNLLVATTLVGLAVAFDPHGPILVVLFFINVAILIAGGCLHLVYKSQILTAQRFAPYLYSRGMLSVLRWTCGKAYSAWALCNYAVRLSATGQYDAAIAAYTRVLTLDASSADYWAYRGAANYNAGALTAAECDLTQAITLDRDHEMSLACRGYTRLLLGKCRAAIDDLDRIRCKDSTHSSIALFRGRGHELLGEWQDAIRDYLLAHELDPSETDAGIALARLQAACPVQELRDGSKAVENAYRMCVRIGWNNWEAVSVLAAAHAEQGNFETATEFAKQAFDLAPDEEKTERQQRVEQFQAHIPFRLSQSDRILN